MLFALVSMDNLRRQLKAGRNVVIFCLDSWWPGGEG